jgi:hypothetical protein
MNLLKRRRVLFAIYDSAAAGSRWVSAALSAHHDVLSAHGPSGAFSLVSGESLPLTPVQMGQLLLGIAFPRGLVGTVEWPDTSWDGEMRATFGDDYRRAVLLRDPIRRADSITRVHAQREERDGVRREDWPVAVRARIAEFGTRLPWDAMTQEQRHFAHACWELSLAATTTRLDGVESFRFEDLIADYETDCRLLAHLSDGELTAWPDDARGRLEDLRSTRLGKHTGESRSGLEVWSSWPDWKRELFCLLFSREAADVHRSVGYELPTIRPAADTAIPRTNAIEFIVKERADRLAQTARGPGLIIGLGQIFEGIMETGALDELTARGVTIDAADDDPQRRARFADRFRAVTSIDDVDPSKYARVHIAAILDAERAIRDRLAARGVTSAQLT